MGDAGLPHDTLLHPLPGLPHFVERIDYSYTQRTPRVPWHEFEQERVVGFQPGGIPLAMFTTPLLCVAAFTVVLL